MKKTRLLGVFIFGMSFIISCSSGNSPSGVVKKFYNYTAEGKVNDAVELISKEGQNLLNQYGGGTSTIATGTQKINAKGGIKSIDITEEQIVGDTATVKCVINYGNGSTENDNSKLIKQDGKWKLSVSK